MWKLRKRTVKLCHINNNNEFWVQIEILALQLRAFSLPCEHTYTGRVWRLSVMVHACDPSYSLRLVGLHVGTHCEQFNVNQSQNKKALGCSLVAKHLPNMKETWCSIPSTAGKESEGRGKKTMALWKSIQQHEVVET